MRKKFLIISGALKDLSNREDLEKTGVVLIEAGGEIKAFYPENQEPPDLMFSKPDKFVESGDKGCGVPGSIEFHTAFINQSDGETIGELVKKVTGEEVIVKGRIDYARKRAIKAIKRYLDDNDV